MQRRCWWSGGSGGGELWGEVGEFEGFRVGGFLEWESYRVVEFEGESLRVESGEWRMEGGGWER